jgi:hypothetical protein
MPKGGARRGAGAKRGSRWKSTLKKQAAYDLYRQEVLAHMAPIVRAQVEAATGEYATVLAVERTEDGVKLRRVTTELELEAILNTGTAHRIVFHEPDMTISKYVTDQVVGKPTEHLEVSGPNGGPIPTLVRFVSADA